MDLKRHFAKRNNCSLSFMLDTKQIYNNNILSSLTSQIAVIDHTGVIIAVNKAWNDFANKNGATSLERISEGSNYFISCRKSIANGDGTAAIALKGIQSVLQKDADFFEMEYACHSPQEQRWFILNVSQVESDDQKVVVSHHDITHRRKAEDAVKESEIRYRRLFESAKDGILILDGDSGKIADANPFLLNLIGYDFNELYGKELWEIGLFSDVAASKNAFLELQKNEYIRYDNLPLKHKNGTIHNVEFISNVYSANNENVIQCNIRDITQKLAASAFLQQNEQKIRKLSVEREQEREGLNLAQSVAKLGSWETELDSLKVSWSMETFRIFGIEPYSILPTHEKFLAFIHPDDRERVDTAFKDSFDNPDIDAIEHRIITAQGKLKFILEHWQIFTSEEGLPIKAVGTCQDITDRKKEEEQLKLFESVITHTTDSILITEAEPSNAGSQRILYVNDSFTVMTGYTSEEVIGNTPAILQGPKTDPEMMEYLRNSIEMGEACKVEVLNYKKNGEEFWNNISIVPVTDDYGRPTHWISVERDVTKRKQGEVSLQEKNNELKKLYGYLQNVREEERKRLAREVHDELGQLASALKIDIDWLGIKVEGLNEMGKSRITHANKTLEVLLTSIRKIASGLRPSVLDDFGLNAAVKAHCEEFERLNVIPCIFQSGFNEENLAMNVKTELFRIIQESMTNVMRHAKAKDILIRTSEDTENLYLTITDNGIGFDQEKKKNTLGLIGLRERAISLHGRLEIESRVGKGTIISAIIPKNTTVPE